MKNHIILLSLTGFLLTAFSCSSDQKTEHNISQAPPIEVKVQKIKHSSKPLFYTSSGKVQSAMQTNLSTRMMGYVQTIHTKIGDQVKQGQLLVKLNSKDLNAKKAQIEAGISEATAAFNNAEKDYNRFKSLYKSESASQKELDDITAHFEMAKARLEGAKQMKQEINAQLEYTNILAPFSGTVSAKFINQGDLANPGMPLLSIENNHTFEVLTMVSESEIALIKVGMEVDVLIKSINKTIKGKVKEFSTSTLHSGAQYQVKIALESYKGLFSGMYTQVQFPISTEVSASKILLPQSALIQRGQLQGVYVVSQQNTAILRWLRLGHHVGDQIEILSGINPGDQYIVSAKGKLENGSPLTLLK